MTDIPSALAAHLSGRVTTLCQCWILTLRNAERRGFTDHDCPLLVDGVTCAPDTGFAASEATSRLGLAVDGMEIDGALSSPQLDEDEIADGLLDGARVETFLVDWQDPGKKLRLRVAVVGKVTRADGRLIAELKSLTESLDRVEGRLVRRHCDAEFGDARCGFDLERAGFSVIATVIGIDAVGLVSVQGVDGFEPEWFSTGTAAWLTGSRAGLSDRIDRHDRPGGQARLSFSGFPRGVVPGDQARLRAGCDKHFGTCSGKFGNTLNFRGFPHLPGNDAAYSYAQDGAVFDGRPIVP